MGELLDDLADLRRGGVLEDVEGTEAAVGRLQGILLDPAAIDVVVEVGLRAHLEIHVCKVDGGLALALGCLSAGRREALGDECP